MWYSQIVFVRQRLDDAPLRITDPINCSLLQWLILANLPAYRAPTYWFQHYSLYMNAFRIKSVSQSVDLPPQSSSCHSSSTRNTEENKNVPSLRLEETFPHLPQDSVPQRHLLSGFPWVSGLLTLDLRTCQLLDHKNQCLSL